MITSVRARLTLWHTSVLAVLLALFAVAAYSFVRHTSHERTDAAISDAANNLLTELVAERPSHPTTADAAAEVLHELRFRTIAFAVYDSAGNVVASSPPPPRRSRRGDRPHRQFDSVALGRLITMNPPRALTLTSTGRGDGAYRAAIAPLRFDDGAFVAAAVQSLHEESETLAQARLAILVAIPAALVLAWIGGWMLAQRSLAPMVELRRHTARIGAKTLGDRVPITIPDDEVGQLAAVINDLLTRLERAFAQQRQFMADASHELRTPVAVVLNEATLALSRPHRDPAEYEEALRVVRAAARRTRRIVDDLFLLARADAGELPLRRAPAYLGDIAAECAREARSLAEQRGVSLTVEPMPEMPCCGDEPLLHRLVINLLDNAIKYSPAGSCVTIRGVIDPRALRLEVEDTGRGIPVELQPRIFGRFVRADEARSHDGDTMTSGAGLGLSIARCIAEAHGGSLDLVRSDESGSLFAFRMPAGDCQ